MGTRYDEGDVVMHRQMRTLHSVVHVRNPASDSPDYVVQSVGSNRQLQTVKANDIRKPPRRA